MKALQRLAVTACFVSLIASCSERPSATSQSEFRGSGVPLALAAKGALDINMGASGLFIPPPISTQSQQYARRIDVTKEFVAELKDGLTFSDPLIALLDECLRSVA